MKIKTKFLLIILLTIFSFTSSLSVYFLLAGYIKNIRNEKNQLTELEESMQRTRMKGSEIFMDNSMTESWETFNKEYEKVLGCYDSIEALKILPRINDSMGDSLSVIAGLNSLMVEKYFITARIYEDLIQVLKDVKFPNLPDVRLSDFYVENYIRNYDRNAYIYYLADTFQTQYTHLDYILDSALKAIDFQMAVIESESRKGQVRIILISVSLCLLLVAGSVFCSLLMARRIVEDTKIINRSLFTMIESTQPVSIGINRKDELGEVALNIEQIFKQLLKTKDQLVQQEKMASLGHLIAGVAHEINTPLGSCITTSSYLKSESENLEDRFLNQELTQGEFENFLQKSRESHRLLKTNLNRTADLIQSFKALTIDESSQDRQWVDLNQYVHDALFSFKALSMKNNIRMSVDFSEPVKLYCLPTDFFLILTHLVQNSLNHGFRNKLKGSISISFQKLSGENLLVRYRDDGEGMPEEVLKKAFDPFFTTNRGKDGGIGLGLYIVFNLISHVFKGTVTCTSEIGKGTEFVIKLPLNPLKNSLKPSTHDKV